ncbi:MAG: alpha/beta hydrolase [Chitinophagaceae bacterium]|nr:alpha/beta hydrolase [Chitinophagaceae bacterium]MCB9046666.1 alpha/beta hydrolase [Chitinophagales bacterium]
MNKLLVIISVLLTCNSFGQGYSFNTEEWWHRLAYEEQMSAPGTANLDTCIVVASNRFLTGDKLRFMSETRGDGTLLYFFVYAYKGQWHVLKQKSLASAVKLMPHPNEDWVIYTEGMGKIFTSELNRGMMMSSQYGVNVIMLDYPSITTTKGNLGNYLFSIKNARLAYVDHVPMLEEIKQLKANGKLGTGKISLFFHSMGNYLLRQTVKKKQLLRINDTKWADNIILNSACVPQYHHTKWLNKVSFAQNIYIQYNPEDRTLFWAELISKKKQLGRRLRNPVSSMANYVNFNKVVGEEHSYFLTLQGRMPAKDITKKYYNVILHGGNINFKDPMYKPSTYRNIGYEVQP